MLARIRDSVRSDSLTASMDRGRSQVSSDCHLSSRGSRHGQCRRQHTMRLTFKSAVIIEILVLLGLSYNNCFRSSIF